MKKSLKIIFVLLGAFLLKSCLLDDNVTDFGKGPIVVEFAKKETSQNFLKDDSGKIYDYKIQVQYFGGNNEPLKEPVKLTVEVSDLSTAKEGVEFSIPNKEVVIPAGSSVGEFMVKVNSAQLDSENPKKMVLQIVNSSQTVSNNKKTTGVVLQAICPSDLAGDYVYLNGNEREVTIKSTGEGTYSVSADNAFRGKYSFEISDVCGKLKVTGGFLKDNHGIALSGHGNVDETTGNITIHYTADGYFENREMILKKK
ncbi:hypothetical protein [Capnocytophaga canimorsus]|uniref:hypothetical protein n=1 Tax=Capnocytophaga canimorsus TaxID=28188 RepID=UPI0037D1A416